MNECLIIRFTKGLHCKGHSSLLVVQIDLKKQLLCLISECLNVHINHLTIIMATVVYYDSSHGI